MDIPTHDDEPVAESNSLQATQDRETTIGEGLGRQKSEFAGFFDPDFAAMLQHELQHDVSSLQNNNTAPGNRHDSPKHPNEESWALLQAFGAGDMEVPVPSYEDAADSHVRLPSTSPPLEDSGNIMAQSEPLHSVADLDMDGGNTNQPDPMPSRSTSNIGSGIAIPPVHNSADTPLMLSFPPLPSPPPDCRWPLDNEDGVDIPSQLGRPPSPAPSSMDIGEFLADADAGDEVGPEQTIAEALDAIRVALESENKQEVPFELIPPTAQFKFAWGSIDGTTARSLLGQLTRISSIVGDETIDYFSHKLRSSELWIGRLPQLTQLRQPRCRVLVILGDTTEWSIIEGELDVSRITHSFPRLDPASVSNSHESCCHRREFAHAISRVQDRGIDAWSRRAGATV